MFCSVVENDLIVNCGMFATGMTCSHEQLIMDEEISAMSKRIAEGIKVTEDTVAADLIKEIGAGSAGDSYLTAGHTIKWLRTEQPSYFPPQIEFPPPVIVFCKFHGKL